MRHDIDRHEHGVAHLQIAVAGNDLQVRFKSPQDSLVGFETAPRTEKQRQAVRRMAGQLHRPQWLFIPTAEAECSPAGVTLAAGSINPALLASGADAHGHAGSAEQAREKEPAQSDATSARKATGKGHADVTAAISFLCRKPQSLTGMQVRLFDAFQQIRQIDVEIVTTKGESGARLTPNRTGLTW